MNALLRSHVIGALAATAALLAGACSASSGGRKSTGEIATYRTHDGRVVHYTVAPEAKLRNVEVTAAGGRTVIRLTTEAPMPPSGGPLAIDVHFSDRREIAFVRNFAYPSLDPFEGAAVLDVRTGAVLGKVDVTVDGSLLKLAFNSALVTGQPRIAVSRYLPSRAALGEAMDGLEGAYAAMYKFGVPGTLYAAMPFAESSRSRSDLGMMHVAVPFAESSRSRSADRAIARDVHFGPPPGTTNFDPKTPVIQIPSGEGTIDAVDHDSSWPGAGDYVTGDKDVCGHAILCGWFTWTAKVSFVGGCGADLDGDGQLDGNELRWYFGFCAFPSAINDTWQDGRGYVHWLNVGRGDHATEIYEYISAPTTGNLRVRHSSDRGATWASVYEGPGRGGPNGWKFFPAPPPAPAAAC